MTDFELTATYVYQPPYFLKNWNPGLEIWIRANRGKGDRRGKLKEWRCRGGATVLKYISTRIRVFSFGRRLFYYRYNKNKTFLF